MQVSGLGPIWSTITALACRIWGKSRQDSQRSDLRASKHWVRDFLNMQLKQSVLGPSCDAVCTPPAQTASHLGGLVSGNHLTCLRCHALLSKGSRSGLQTEVLASNPVRYRKKSDITFANWEAADSMSRGWAARNTNTGSSPSERIRRLTFQKKKKS